MLVMCTDELSECGGQRAVKDYVISTRPSQCEDTSAATRGATTLSLLLVALGLSLLHGSL